MTARDDAIAACRKAWGLLRFGSHMGEIVAAMVDAADPIIRADERDDLRAKVEALRRPPIPWVPIDDVLALLPEVSE